MVSLSDFHSLAVLRSLSCALSCVDGITKLEWDKSTAESSVLSPAEGICPKNGAWTPSTDLLSEAALGHLS